MAAAGLPAPAPREGERALPGSVGAGEAYARLRQACLALLVEWAGYGLEERVAFAEKRGARLRAVEAAMILVSNLPERLGAADRAPLAASFESGELAILGRDRDREGYALAECARRLTQDS